jgi:hypothetical protein
VVQRALVRHGRLDVDGQALLHLALADEVVEGQNPKRVTDVVHVVLSDPVGGTSRSREHR